MLDGADERAGLRADPAEPPQTAPAVIAPIHAKSSGQIQAMTEDEPASRGPEVASLNPRYTFDAYVVGPSNQLAHAASRAVAEIPAEVQPALHLWRRRSRQDPPRARHRSSDPRKHPSARIVYLKTETFMNEYINRIRNGKIDEFRRKYRERCDVLLMDDMQFLAGKDRTQDEFFHTFNSLFENHNRSC